MTSAALEWTYQPWRESPGRAAVAAGFTATAAGLLLAASGSAVLTAVLTLAVAAQLAALLVPTRCRVDDEGVRARGPFGWERRDWSVIRRARVGHTGLWVSPYATPRRMDRFRALMLPMPRAERAALVAALEPILDQHHLA
jgi:Bacterial PH domain